MRVSDRNGGSLSALKERAFWIVAFVACIWMAASLNAFLGLRLDTWGLYPRTLRGVPGIFLAPLLHDGLPHVLANTVPFVVLGSLVILRGVREFLELTVFVVAVGGGAVWLVGRPAYHVGASGLIMGYLGFLVARGWYERSFTSAIIAVFVVLCYGGALWGVLPGAWTVSWEMHLFGLLAGILAARVMFGGYQRQGATP